MWDVQTKLASPVVDELVSKVRCRINNTLILRTEVKS